MRLPALFAGALSGLLLLGSSAQAQERVALNPVEGDLVVKDFKFRSGESLPELRLHYTTLGAPKRDAKGHVTNAVLIMHGTGGWGGNFFRPQFGDVLFRPGGLLDPARYYIILPDDIGHGKSSKPSDGLHAKFPHYGYHDMVEAEHLLVHEGLKVDHLRLVMGTSMGCMHSFMWGEAYPDEMDALMPLACLPSQIAGRNRLWRRMVTQAIVTDPAWQGGEYKTPPVQGLRTATDLLIIAGSAPIQMQKDMPTRDAADAWEAQHVGEYLKTIDANDFLYQVSSSADYDPSPDLEKIKAPVLWINSADDFINPPSLPIAAELAKRIPHGRYIVIPESDQTHGHGTHTWAAVWQDRLAELLKATEK